MMTPIRFFAAGIPKGMPRVKAFARKMGDKFVARVYTPDGADPWKDQIALAAKPFLPEMPLSMPLYLHLEFFFPRPKAHYLRGQIRGSAPGYHVGRPDIDNAAKAVMDALTICRMWNDDAQIADCRVRKLYDDGRGSGCIIEIKEV
jgi:Holliday junction resolvase RusA-like endonuclease